MSIPTILLLLMVAAAAGSAAVLVARLMQYRNTPQADDPEVFSLVRYAPMARLLDPADVAFLAAQPGMDAKAVEKFKLERRRVFRLYLRELVADFGLLHRQARELVAVSPDKNADLVENLVRLQVRFWGAVASVELQLALQHLGIGQVDAGRLLDAVDSLHSAVVRATSIPGPIPVV